MSELHAASLVDTSAHSPAMLELLELQVDDEIIEYLIQCTIDVVECAMDPTVPRSRKRSESFATFASKIIQKSRVPLPVLLVVIVYIDRGRSQLAIQTQEWACERVFLGALVVASKYLNDLTLRNTYWAKCTGCLGKRDIGRIERDYLNVLQWDLSVSESDILYHHDAIISLYDSRCPSPVSPEPLPLDESCFCFADSDSSESDSMSSTSSAPGTPSSLEYYQIQSHGKVSSPEFAYSAPQGLVLLSA